MVTKLTIHNETLVDYCIKCGEMVINFTLYILRTDWKNIFLAKCGSDPHEKSSDVQNPIQIIGDFVSSARSLLAICLE